jgi:formamidopyrimidine-DNA glycosylase
MLKHPGRQGDHRLATELPQRRYVIGRRGVSGKHACPELPDVENYKRYLQRRAMRLPITDVQVNDVTVLDGVSEQRFKQCLTGARFASAQRYGKHLLVHLDSGIWLTMHFGMTGALSFFENTPADPRFHRVRFDFDSDRHLAYSDQRMLGRLGLAEKGEADVFIHSRGLGPDALDPKLTLAKFRDALHGAGAVKAALMDQGRIAGIGNLYADEILFQAKIHPRTFVAALTDKQTTTLYRTMRHVLKTAIARGAGSENFSERLPEEFLLRHRDKDGKCPHGHGPLQTLRFSGRTAYYCAECQPKP